MRSTDAHPIANLKIRRHLGCHSLFRAIFGFLALPTVGPRLVVVIAALAHPIPGAEVSRKVIGRRSGFGFPTFPASNSDSIVVVATGTEPISRAKVCGEIRRREGVGEEARSIVRQGLLQGLLQRLL